MLSIWDPFGEFGFKSQASTASYWKPSVDIHEEENALQLTVEVPGINQEDLRVEVHNGMLTLSGVRERKAQASHRSEVRYGSFKRSFMLTDELDPDTIDAKYDAGMLYVTIPKKPIAQARRIEIT